MGRERNDHGRYSDRIPPDTVLNVFDERDDLARPLTASDVVDELGIARRTAHNKLNALVERGVLETRKVGARGRVWWVPIPADRNAPVTGTFDESGRESATDATRSQARGTSDDGRDGTDGDTRAENGALAAEARRYLEEQDKPPKTTHGRDAVIEVFRQLREHGTRSTGDLQADVYPAYADHWGSERAMWNALDRYLEGVPGIEKGGYGEWAYAGDDVVREALEDAGIGMGDGYDPTEEF